LQITSAEISIDTTSLGNLLTNHVFAYPGSPLKSLGPGHGVRIADDDFYLVTRPRVLSDLRRSEAGHTACRNKAEGRKDAKTQRAEDPQP